MHENRFNEYRIPSGMLIVFLEKALTLIHMETHLDDVSLHFTLHLSAPVSASSYSASTKLVATKVGLVWARRKLDNELERQIIISVGRAPLTSSVNLTHSCVATERRN